MTKLKTPAQSKFFQERYIWALGKSGYKEVDDLQKIFLSKCSAGAETLSPAEAADLFQKTGRTRTAMQRKEELADVDVNNDGQISFIEFLVLHFKLLILKEYFQRAGKEPDVDMGNGGVGLTGVGSVLMEELFAPPAGIDHDLEKLMKDFSEMVAKKDAKLKELEAAVAQGGVKGMGAKNQLEQFKKGDDTSLHAVEAKIAAAINKAKKKSAEELAKYIAEDASAGKDADEARKQGLAARKA